jgi:hypothetical protein
MSEPPFDYWQFFLAETRRSNAPLYEAFTRGVAEDEDLKSLAYTVRAGQPPANVLYAAVHYLLLRGNNHELRRFYPNLNRGTARDNLDQAFPLFRQFVAENRNALVPIVRSRVTNTNEVGRCAVLHAGFHALAREAGEPLHLIELGPSAGLNLIWDRYQISYRRNGNSVTSGVSPAPLVIETELRGERSPPHGCLPRVASRLGLERDPVDLSVEDERDWLRALVWPDHVARFAKLEQALAIASQEKLPIRRGDALELLADALAAAPVHETVCVYHSFVTYQFSREQRAALDDLLIAASLRRPVWRLSFEGTVSGDAPLVLYGYRNGLRTKRLLAQCQPHGAWLEWVA